MSEMRAQKLEPCEHPVSCDDPDAWWMRPTTDDCYGCAAPDGHPGQRWVTVGTLRQPTFATFGCRVLQPYLLDGGLSIREMDDEEAESGDRPLYVIEDTP